MGSMKEFLAQHRAAKANGTPLAPTKTVSIVDESGVLKQVPIDALKPPQGGSAMVPAKPKKEKPPPGQQITHNCGHKTAIAWLENQPCPACRNQQRQEKAKRKREKQASKPGEVVNDQRGRLPGGSSFTFEYNAEKTEWSGRLKIHQPDGEVYFGAASSGVMKLACLLDDQYREWLGENRS
jgi:hypothetical protein